MKTTEKIVCWILAIAIAAVFICGVARATVSSTTTQNVYTTTGTTVTFPYSFKVFDEDDIYVAYIASDGVETEVTTGFSVTGVGETAGNVVFSLTPTTGQTLLIRRETVQHQEVDLVPNARLSATTLEDEFDKLTMIAQDMQNQLDRTVKFKANTGAGATVPLPEPVALNYLQWNSAADGLINTADGIQGLVTLGTMAAQDADAVAITGGSIVGITDLAIADGGTGASTASTARDALGLGTGDSPEFYNATISNILTVNDADIQTATISGWLNSAGGGYYTNSVLLGITRPSGSVIFDAIAGCTITGGTYDGMEITDAEATEMTINTLNLGVGPTTASAYGISLLGTANAAGGRTLLELGTIATQDSDSISVTGGSMDGVTIGNSTPAAADFTTMTATTMILGSDQIQNMAIQAKDAVDIDGGFMDSVYIGYYNANASAWFNDCTVYGDLVGGVSAELTATTLNGVTYLNDTLAALGANITYGTFTYPSLVEAEAGNMTISTLLITNGGLADDYSITTLDVNTATATASMKSPKFSDADGDTYVWTETGPGNDDDELRFYASASKKMTVSASGVQIDTIDANGGAIDATIIGAATPADASFDEITATTCNFTAVEGGDFTSVHLYGPAIAPIYFSDYLIFEAGASISGGTYSSMSIASADVTAMTISTLIGYNPTFSLSTITPKMTDADADTYIEVEGLYYGWDSDRITLVAKGNKVLMADSGTMTVTSTTSFLEDVEAPAITDGDNDTYIRLETTADSDDDEISLTAGGTEAVTITTDGVYSHGNGLIEGDTTTGRVMRVQYLTIEDGTTGVSIKLSSGGLAWNSTGTDFPTEDDIAKSDSSADYALNAGGSQITMKNSGTASGAFATVLSATISLNLSGTAVTVWYLSGGDNAIFNFYNAATGAAVDLTTLVDTGTITMSLTYLTTE